MDGLLCVLSVMTVQNNTNTGCDVCGMVQQQVEDGCMWDGVIVCCGTNEKNGSAVVNTDDLWNDDD